ncbi:MAG TPA: hypothetical protein VMH83_09130, partial [Candidatus Acidoferrum sp.]|nr:hypothetical protein [Candidatus Acidoferrum sp.]
MRIASSATDVLLATSDNAATPAEPGHGAGLFARLLHANPADEAAKTTGGKTSAAGDLAFEPTPVRTGGIPDKSALRSGSKDAALAATVKTARTDAAKAAATELQTPQHATQAALLAGAKASANATADATGTTQQDDTAMTTA